MAKATLPETFTNSMGETVYSDRTDAEAATLARSAELGGKAFLYTNPGFDRMGFVVRDCATYGAGVFVGHADRGHFVDRFAK